MKKLLFALTILLTFGCREDSLITNTVIDEPIPIETQVYEFDVFGLVVDEDDQPIEIAILDANGEMQTSDENGFFEFKDQLASDKGLYITAQKEGYADGGALVFPDQDFTQKVKIVLAEISTPTLLVNSEGGTIELEEFTQLVIPPDAFESSGELTIKTYYLPNNGSKFHPFFPSELLGLDTDEELKYLLSVGAVYVEVFDSEGNEVELKEGVEVLLRVVIPSDNVPDIMPLWSLNETTGYWEEESFVKREGGFYEGKLTHFSWWNVCEPEPTQEVCFSFKTEEGDPIQNFQITLVSLGKGTYHIRNTNEDGEFCLNLPEEARYAVLAGFDECTPTIDNEAVSITPGQSKIELVVDLNIEEVAFSGSITNCDGSIVENGYVIIRLNNGQEVVQIVDGAYSYISNCAIDNSSTLEIIAVNSDDLTSASKFINTEANTHVNDLTLCESLETFLLYKNLTTGDDTFLASCRALKNPQETVIIGEDGDSPTVNILLGIEGFDVGTFGTSLFGSDLATALPTDFSTTITRYDGLDGFVQGSFSGTTDTGDKVEGEFIALRTK